MGQIVVGVDGSELSIAALRWAIDEARASRRRGRRAVCVGIPACHEPGDDVHGPAGALSGGRGGDLERALAGANPGSVPVIRRSSKVPPRYGSSRRVLMPT